MFGAPPPPNATLPGIKYGARKTKKNSSKDGTWSYHLKLVRLKNFVKASGRTGFCVDTENAAV